MSFRLLPVAIALALVQSQPTFRSGVGLIRLDVSVVDKSGQPVGDLKAEDFTVRVDGTVRKVSFARFYGADAGRPLDPVGTASAAYASNTNRSPGRLLILVVDLQSIKPGSEKLVFDTAARLVSSLGQSDYAGLIPLPGRGTEATLGHPRVLSALATLRGQPAARNFRHTVSLDEAAGFARGDSVIIDEVLDRECRSGDFLCANEVRDQAREMPFDATERLRLVLSSLTALNTRLAQIDSPKSVVLISGGLGFPKSELPRLRDLERSAAASGTSMYVVQVEQPESDAGSGRPSTGTLPRSDLFNGLDTIAGATNGAMFAGIGTASGVFDRIQAEVLNSYQLGVEFTSRDADGKGHKIDVDVRRPDLVVKSRKELILAGPAATPRTPVDVLGLPGELSVAPMTASTYVLRGDQPSSLMVLMTVESLDGASEKPPSYAVTLENDGGVIFNNTADLVKTPGGGSRATIATHLPPGRYRLRAAVVDAAGRAGSVDMPVVVGLRQASPFQLSDLMLGPSGGSFATATHVAPGSVLSAFMELYASDPQQFDNAAVDFELSKVGVDTPIARGNAELNRTELDRRRIAEGRLELEGLGPGSYTVSAIIRKGPSAVGKVSRPFVVKGP